MENPILSLTNVRQEKGATLTVNGGGGGVISEILKIANLSHLSYHAKRFRALKICDFIVSRGNYSNATPS